MFRLQQLRADLNLGDEITFLGKKSQDILPYYYSSADIVVVPSHYESFGMVALEAMACGTPVIASQVGGLAYLVQDGITGYHIPNQDPDALSQRLLSILQNRNLQMGEQAADYAKEYSWENITEQIVNVYNRVIRGTEI
jgi:D-inositol-3-phosphate glycosyltransferase